MSDYDFFVTRVHRFKGTNQETEPYVYITDNTTNKVIEMPEEAFLQLEAMMNRAITGLIIKRHQGI